MSRIRESNTGYGTSSGDEKDFRKRHPKVKLIDVPFPLHISGVHAKHEEALRRDEANVPQFSAFDHGLKIPVNKGEGARDTLPQQDEVMSAVYQDIALSAALQTLAKQKVPYILISATSTGQDLSCQRR